MISALMIAALLSVGVISSLFLKNIEAVRIASTSPPVPIEEIFGPDGLPSDTLLQTDPVQITETYVIFTDRVLEILNVTPAQLLTGGAKISEAMQNVPTGINKCLLVAPSRIAFEEEACPEESADVLTAIRETYSRMPSDVITIDVAEKLSAHEGEYLYFRTAPSWTAMGAFFGASAYCESSGITPPELLQYRESRFTGYSGVFQAVPEASSLLNFPDYVAFYISDGMTNKQTITAHFSTGEYITYDSPSVSQARMGNDIFVGGYFSHAIIEGDGQDGKIIMIVGDDYAKSFAIWMIPCYERIVIIDPRFYNGSDSDFMNMFDDYRVTDFLILEGAVNLGESILNTRIHQLLTGGTPER